MLRSAIFSAALVATTNAYWLMGVNNLFETPQRLDPLLFSGQVAGHAHKILGGSNFGPSVDSASLRASECTTTPIQEDKSAYWVPHMYFQWSNGSFSDVGGGAVIYYLFPNDGNKTATFPDKLRMITGSADLRTYDESSAAQRAVTFLCLDYRPGSKSSRHEKMPDIECPDGVRSELNFQSCWDGENYDSDDHKSHVAYRSGGPDSGDCLDPKYPVSIPRIFLEIYWGTQDFNEFRSQAKNPSQPFVLANGDPFGYSYHGDFINGWDTPTLRNAIDHCNCNIYGDPQCCADQGVFTYEKEKKCKKTNMVNEKTTGTLDALPGVNPVTTSSIAPAPAVEADSPGFVTPVFVYTDGVYPDADYTETPAPAASSGNTATGNDDNASDDADEDSSTDEDSDATDDDADTTASSAAAAATTTSSTAAAATTSSTAAAATTSSSAAAAATATSVGGVLAPVSGSTAPSTCNRGNNNTRRRRHVHRRRLEYDANTF